MNHRVIFAWLALTAAAATFVPPDAAAQATPAAKQAEARRLFKAGARAYQAGKLHAAIQAFEQAYELDPNPALRFSAAQALRRQYSVEPDPALLRRSLAYYRQYLEQVPEGRRRLDALKAVGALQLLLAQQEPTPPPDEAGGDETIVDGGPAPLPTAPAAPRRKAKTGTLSVDASVAGASVSVDGKPPEAVPAFVDLAPGRHQVVVSAKGYVPVERQVSIVAGRMKAIDPVLEEMPAQLTIAGFEDAEVLVDGRPVGRTPLPAPLSLPSGEHRVVAGHNGYGVFVQDLDLQRGQTRAVEVDLSMTAQRVTAWVLFGGATLSTGAFVVLQILGAARQREARDIINKAENEDRALERSEAEDYNSAISSRDNLQRVAGIAGGAALLSGGLGLLLYALDEPGLYEAASEQPEPAADGRASPSKEIAPSVRVVPMIRAKALTDQGNEGVSWGLLVRGRF